MFKKNFLITIFFFILLLQTSKASPILIDKIVAIINSDVILLSDVDDFLRTLPLRKELDPLFGLHNETIDNQLNKDSIVKLLIQEKIISQTYKISNDEVEQEINLVQKNNRLTKEDLVNFLNSKGFSYDEYFDLMKMGLEKRALLDREIRNRVNITDDDIKNYYLHHYAKNKSLPINYKFSIITISFSTYNNKKTAESIANEAYQRLKQGESFESVAKNLSDDSVSQNGGDMGYLPSQSISKEVLAHLENLKIGETSGVIKTQFGFIILKLTDIKSGDESISQEIKDKIREELAKQEYKKQLSLWAERATNTAYIHINSY
jgi:peptidyl-prolyl cis-trans isomerase SurA